MSEDDVAWVEAIAAAAGLEMSKARAVEVAQEARRIRAGVAAVATAHFGFHDEPPHFLSALEECAEAGE
ncbi:MAG: hypothetical protein RIM80_21855 [Alphaproteobacteria bacterium]